ncbi:MAG: hemerythrin domain-containing protein [Bacteriovorax sp.]
MSKLIDDLKKDHVALVQLLEEIKAAGPTSPEGKKKLVQAKNGLLAHLKKEDNELYPVLKKAAEKDAKLKSTLEIFASDMAGISGFAMEFFTTYADGGEGIKFAGDWGKLYATLAGRIRKEESTLYAEYNKLNP